MKAFREWFDIALMKKKPAELASEKKSVFASIGNYVAALAVIYLIAGIFTLFFSLIGAIDISSSPIFSSLWVIIVLFIAIPVYILSHIFLSFVFNSLIHLFAIILGGKESFAQTISSLFKVQAAVIGIFGTIMMLLLCTGVLALFVFTTPRDPNSFQKIVEELSFFTLFLAIPAEFYLLYLSTLVLKELHKISALKAFLAIILVILLPILLYFLILAILHF